MKAFSNQINDLYFLGENVYFRHIMSTLVCFSGKYIVSGSENRDIYIWKTNHDYSKFSSVRRDRNDFWEAIKAHNATVTCAIFAPNPEAIIKMLEESCRQRDEHENEGKVIAI